ncbi:hypothetical protein GO730_08025 [Spirosoma sp. HMF3257]|uniref:Uncharacterized protein n=1 Tax=Spirosoma telluris TaxID=2183553 RepID=A0A327NG01_9BACT|nr:hypothetical protein [Spirosoma telluris]RAI74271.1 hypothetical protein HMF3257_07935 [Spirosoma telluris]
MLAAIALVILLVLNLIPFAWAKYTAFSMVMLPFAVMLLDNASSKVKDIIGAITYSQSDYDGSKYFSDPQQKAILAAAFDEDVEKVESLLRKPMPLINGLDTEGKQTILDYTASHYSPYSNDWEKTKRIMELLIAAGATINSSGSTRVSTHATVAWNAPPIMLKFLLDHGADPNAKGENGVPILYEAIRSGGEESMEKVGLLLDRGADCNLIGSYDRNTTAILP